MFRRDLGDEVEFMTIMWFDSRAYEHSPARDHEASVAPPPARELLSRFDGRARHYEVRQRRIP